MKICLCGSTRFKADYEEANRQLSRVGHLVYSVSCFQQAGDELTEVEKRRLDLVHLKKILESDLVVVVGRVAAGRPLLDPEEMPVPGEGGWSPYIGDSTLRELEWAKLNDKRVVHWNVHRQHLLGHWGPWHNRLIEEAR